MAIICLYLNKARCLLQNKIGKIGFLLWNLKNLRSHKMRINICPMFLSFARHNSSKVPNFPELLKTTKPDDKAVIDNLHAVMRKVPQQVVVVTAGTFDKENNKWIKRGVTCTSFTSVSFSPPIVSFCLYKNSSMHDLLQSVDHFALHVLANNQVRHAMHFANNPGEGSCQFESIAHIQREDGLPIIIGSLAVIVCHVHSVHTVGDHHVWYSNVLGVSVAENLQDPLLYFIRSFCSVGDEVFLQAFEHATLPFEDWTHEAHLRMSWNYIREYGKEAATPYIKLGIQKFNDQNKEKIKTGYHETITVFFIHMVSDALKNCSLMTSFQEFLETHKYLCDKEFIFEYYNKDTLFKEEARHRFISPDKKPLP